MRLATLRAGDLDMLERLTPSDATSVRADDSLQFAAATSLGYQGITVNVGNGPRAETPLGQDKCVRQALSLAIDRNVINQVVCEGVYADAGRPTASHMMNNG